MSNSEPALTCLSSAGCHLPGKQVPMARLIREDALAALWPTVAGDAVAVGALELACNLHPEARWWIVHQREVQGLIADAMVCLLALRHSAGEPLKDAT
jgi:hypothetical protein